MQEASVKQLGPQAIEYARSGKEVQLQDATIDIPYAATLVLPVVEYDLTTFNVAALTGNTIVPAIVGARKGMKVTFLFAQDGTGGRTITWNSAFAASANSGSTASHVAATTFVYSGTRWVQEGGALTFKA